MDQEELKKQKKKYKERLDGYIRIKMEELVYLYVYSSYLEVVLN